MKERAARLVVAVVADDGTGLNRTSMLLICICLLVLAAHGGCHFQRSPSQNSQAW
jgi:hypothetical protein